MASKRMFSNSVLDTDAFIDMPLSAQALYFHLNLKADDDGFIGTPKRIQRGIGASDDDLKLLIAKRFLLAFDDGVVVVKHWRMHNNLSRNRYFETNFLEDKAKLLLKANGAYSFTEGEPIDDSHKIEQSKRVSKEQSEKRRVNDASMTHTEKKRKEKNSKDIYTRNISNFKERDNNYSDLQTKLLQRSMG